MAAAEPAWEAVIGLETHVQLGTDSKIFTSASTSFGDDPNTHIDPVVCGLPGTLPVLNQKVLEYAVKAAMALNLNIAEHSKFDRKQYFYPDLPKNYQISQYDEPIAEEGWIEVEVAEKGKDTYLKKIGIERLHMEEDAGKLVHAGSDRLAGSTHSLVDYNRAGVALAEIVSKPDLRTGREAAEYASEIRRIMRYLGVSDGNMQEGSLRCDVNISVRRGPDAPFGTKVEIKNMNSFSAIQKACEYEIKRQIKAYETGEPIVQETRLWDEGKQLTKSMRSKEGASDYRYFPDPDLGPIEVSAEQREGWRAELPDGGPIPDEAQPYFSPAFLWTRIPLGEEGDALIDRVIRPAFADYLQLYLALVEEAQAVDDERAALLLSGQKRYTAYRAEKDPARGMLTRFYGSEWTESYIHGVLFDLEEAAATSLSPQGS